MISAAESQAVCANRNRMELPAELATRLPGYTFDPVAGGESGANVWRCTLERGSPLYLKAASVAADLHLDQEAARLRWMHERELPVPAVRDYWRSDEEEYLLVDEVPGAAASDPEWVAAIPEVIAALADGLRELHGTSTVGCPFDHSVARQVEAARIQVIRGRVREDDFDEIRMGRRAADLFTDLVASAPRAEDLVFTHGDFCLPNVILHRVDPGGAVAIAGFIDCGRAGVADRYQDLALAARSIARNAGDEWLPAFFRRYGMVKPDQRKLTFFTLLDEFF